MINRLASGLVLIVIGAVLLANTTGYLPWTVWDTAISYWPVLLIGLGLQIALSKWKIPGLALAVIAVLILAAANPQEVRWNYENRMWRVVPRGPGWRKLDTSREWTIPMDARVSRVVLDLVAPSMEVRARGNPELNAEAQGAAIVARVSWNSVEPNVTWNSSRDPEVLVVTIDAPGTRADKGSEKHIYELSVNPSLVTSLEARSGVADVSLDCSLMSVEKVTVSAGVSKVDLRMGLSGRETAVYVSGGVANLSLTVPEPAGVRVKIPASSLISHDFPKQGFIRSGSYWETPNYASSPTRINVTLNCGAGRASVERLPD